MTAFRTHAAALIDRFRGIGRGPALVQRRRRAPDRTDLCDYERLLAGLDLLRDLQRAEERVAFGAAANVRIVMSESRADMPPRRLANLI